MSNLFSEAMRRDPYSFYSRLRAGGPLVHLPEADLWLVLDHEGVRRVLTDTDRFSSNAAPARGGAFEWLLFLDPPRHTALRALIARAFTPRTVAGLEPRIRELSRLLLDHVVGRGEMDLIDDYAVPLPMQVIAALLGLPVEDWRRLKGWADAIMRLADTIAGSPEEALAAAAAFRAADAEMAARLDELTAARREAPTDDLLGRLVAAEVDGQRLSALEILRFVQLLLAAGTETTTNLIGNAVLCLLEHPAERARLEADPSLVPAAIEEVLRHRSPAQHMFRATRGAVEMHGRTIPAGKMVLAGIGAANRDPSVFAEPDRFRIGREPNPHLAFGHGIHFCVGAPLSRLEGRIALGDLLARLPRFARADADPWPPRRPFHVLGPTHLALRFEPAGR